MFDKKRLKNLTENLKDMVESSNDSILKLEKSLPLKDRGLLAGMSNELTEAVKKGKIIDLTLVRENIENAKNRYHGQ